MRKDARDSTGSGLTSGPQVAAGILLHRPLQNRRWMGIEPTRDLFKPRTGFEDQERHQVA